MPTDLYEPAAEVTPAAVVRPPQKHFPLPPGAPGASPMMPTPMGGSPLRSQGQQMALGGMAGGGLYQTPNQYGRTEDVQGGRIRMLGGGTGMMIGPQMFGLGTPGQQTALESMSMGGRF